MLTKDDILQNRYQIIRQLGHGGMGAVYEAIDKRFGEPIALKQIQIGLSDSADIKRKELYVKAFEREAKTLSKARHEAVPYVRDYFSELDSQFLVMELVEGEDLAEMLQKQQSPFPLEDALKWLDQLLDALDYLHTLTPPIIHRDIKPQNLKINSRGKIKLLDFGIAKSIDSTSNTAHQTFVGATLEYSPIEQILRVIDPTFREYILLKHKTEGENVLQQNTDARCDIYAVGATFYHLLTNQQPTEATKRTLEVWSGNQDPLKNPSEFNPNIPLALSAFLLKSMEIGRDNRFASAIEMRQALQPLITAERARQTKPASPIIVSEPAPNYTTATSQAETVPESDLLPTAASIETISGTKFSDGESPEENSNPAGVTVPLNSQSSLPDAKKLTPPIVVEKEFEKPKTKAVKTNWVLPIAAVGVLAVGGIGGTLWLNSANSPEPSKPAANSMISTPTILPTVVPTIETSATPNVESTVMPTQTPDKTDISSKPTPTTKAVKPPAQTSPKRPSSKGDIKKPVQDPNCVFTNSCQ